VKENTGIIDQITNNKPHFIHRTFIEYFAAKEFIYWIEKEPSELSSFKQEFLLTKLLLKPDYRVIRNFFDSQLEKIRLKDNILKLFGQKINELWKEKRESLTDYNEATVLQMSAMESNIKIASFLLDSLK